MTLTDRPRRQALDVKVTPEAQPERFGLAEPGPVRVEPRGGEGEQRRDAERRPAAPEHFEAFGLSLSEPAAAAARRLRPRGGDHGLVVVGVDRDGPADRSGVEPGMTITEIDGKRVESLDDAREAIKGREPSKGLPLRVLHHGAPRVPRDRESAAGARPPGEPRDR